MKKSEKKNLLIGSIFLAMFAVWTALIQSVDVQPLGQNGTSIGFATFNCWFHHFTGVNMAIYTITDWMGLVPVVICLIFAGIGLVQLIKRRSLFRVDADIMILGVYFVIVFLAYAIFEMIPINYRHLSAGRNAGTRRWYMPPGAADYGRTQCMGFGKQGLSCHSDL